MTPAIFGFDEEDTRKVQTAVRGGPDSGIPLFLPYEKQAANRLREKYGSNAFSCGVLLGGCGKLLTLRACDDKKSHFAHRPPVRCNRTARGESSADHLYIGEALSTWLRKQGQPNVDVQYVKQRNARSDTIEVRFGSKRKRRLIHVQMARRSFKEWQEDGERLAAPDGKPSTVRMYGPDSQLSPYELQVTGHALRFRCETVNGTRVVSVGTHLPGHQVEWTSLDRCRLVPAGIITPWLQETPYGIQPKGAGPPRNPARPTADERKQAPAGAVPAPTGLALPLMTGSIAFTGATLSSQENDRSIYDVDAQPIGSALFRARISLPASAVTPEPGQVYVLTERAAVLSGPQDTDPASRWVLRAEGFVRLPAKKAAEWRLLEPPGTIALRDGSPAGAVTTEPQRKPVSTREPGAGEAPAAPVAAPAAPAPSPDDQGRSERAGASGRAAREAFDRMADEFRAAREAGDLARANQIRSDMGPVYALRLSPQDREAATGLMRDFKQWVRDQERKPSSDPVLQAVRAILQDLGTRRGTLTTAELASALTEADRLRHRLSAPLPEAERRALRRWRGKLRRRRRTEASRDTDLPAAKAVDSVEDGDRATARLRRSALHPLADRVRTVLQDTARAGTTVTWSELRRRLGGDLPYLHPDDQGELLVMVDSDTPPNEPLLSALVTGADLSPHGLYHHVRYSLGRKRVPDESVEADWRTDVLRLHQLWRHR
ncbi:competence protein CoiA family protein [Streptomyces leeuwenhoekii]|uniref:competence protein CoiA family protein n=1 Tax=Streptomyces leeuwenhoekii TaxID=1437453 RepID=UPI0036BC5790